ncbi:MAG: two-component regulator propeller domain-containing protein [Pseudomonadota bacterium]
MGRRFLLPLLLLVVGNAASEEWLRFETIDLNDGLSQLSVTSIAQDDQGFIWLGTQAGLNRFDGYDIRTFVRGYNGDEGLSDSYIEALATGGDGALWIGTGSGGLARLDTRTERFEIFRHDPQDPESLPGDQVAALLRDDAGDLWIGLRDGGLVRRDALSERFEPWSEGLPATNVTALAASEEVLLIGTGGGLAMLRFDENSLSPVPGIDGTVTALAAATDGGWWVGSLTGLYRMDDAFQIVRRYRPGDGSGLPAETITVLSRDRGGELWVGTLDGLAKFDESRDAFDAWRHSILDEFSLAADRVASIMEDRHGVVWIGTWTGGVSRVDRQSILFGGERYRDDGSGLPDPRVRDFVEAADGRLWVATLGGGLALFDPETRAFEQIRHDPADPGSIASNRLHAVAVDPDGGVWVGALDAGVSRYDPRTGTSVHFPHLGDDNGGGDPKHVLDLLVDRRGQLWVATSGDGVWVHDLAERTWRHFGAADGLASDVAGHLFETSTGQIWIGHRGSGLTIFDPDEQEPWVVSPEPDRPGGLAQGTITFIHETAAGQLWVATQGAGFARVTTGVGRELLFEHFTSAQGLAADAVGAVLVDEHDGVWVSTLRGISVLHPETGEIRNFYPLDGTQKRAYYVGAGLICSQGVLYFGGIEGITWLGEHALSTDDRKPQTQVTGLYLFNRRLEPGAPELPDLPAASFLERVTFDHRQNIFGIEFAGLHFSQPEANRYQYQLEGFDETWVDTPADRRLATYTNLDAGAYRFRVRSANRDGGWSQPRELDIRVQPTPWETPAAYATYAIAALALFGGIGMVRARQATVRREARRAIREGRERLDLALWGSGDEMWFWDVDTGQLERASHIDVKTQREISDMNGLWEVMHPDDRSHVHERMTRHMRGQSPFFEATYRVRGADGQWIWALSKGRAGPRDELGKVHTVAGATKDITQLKNTERALRELNERLEYMVDERTEDLRRTNDDLRRTLDMLTEAQAQLVESEKMASLGNLVAGVAHEINTPVGVALTAATYMESQLRRALSDGVGQEDAAARLEDQARQQIENVQFLIQNLNRAAELIRSFKQVAVDQSSEEHRRFALAEYLDEILRSLHPRFKRTQHTVTVDCDPDIEMASYPGALYQVLVNLLMNSLDHAWDDDQAGHIQIGVAATGSRVESRYSDDGCGLAPEAEGRVFEPFFTTRRGSGGSGLGMHIVYNLTTNVLAGRITVTGPPGKGLEVVLDLPRNLAADGTS